METNNQTTPPAPIPEKKNYWPIAIIVTFILAIFGVSFAFSGPELSLEEQKKLNFIEGKIIDHKTEKQKQETAIDEWEQKKIDLLGGKDVSLTENSKPQVAEKQPVDHKKVMERYESGDYYGECGTFVNDYLAHLEIDRLVKSPYEDKKALVNYTIDEWDKHWVDGAVAIYDLKNGIGHVSIVKVINGELWVIDANRQGKGLIEKRKYEEYEYKRVVGFFNPYKYLEDEKKK